ncbi:hypothetical protein GALMADRAFT_240744 [Galerina marginata CBS 339.88]|uniref:Uncharacterized protein n=1 Tax=Galerina marginata (strain CBS 339.88) TaxID=685588 RepID=A0A067TTB1_GALM3|nr:hypothetical protein GALMADRAFT_240744 [Galerina marginata CBS 339.88]
MATTISTEELVSGEDGAHEEDCKLVTISSSPALSMRFCDIWLMNVWNPLRLEFTSSVDVAKQRAEV